MKDLTQQLEQVNRLISANLNSGNNSVQNAARWTRLIKHRATLTAQLSLDVIYLNEKGNTYVGNTACKMCTDNNFARISKGYLELANRLRGEKPLCLFHVFEIEHKDESGYWLTLRAAQSSKEAAAKYMIGKYYNENKFMVVIPA